MKAFALIATLVLASGLHAAQTNTGLASTAAAWLDMPTDPRAAAMGGADVAASNRLGALQNNPASLSTLSNRQVDLMDNLGLEGISLQHLAYGQGLGSGAFAVALNYADYGSIDGYSVSSGVISTAAAIKPYAYDADLAYGASFGAVGLGATLKYLGQSLGTGDSSAAFAADLGARWGTKDGGIGLSLRNLGTTLDESNLPCSVDLGGDFSAPSDSSLPWALAAEAKIPVSALSQASINLGLELRFAQMLALRAGYVLADRGSLEGMSGLTAGLGLKYRFIELNYAILFQGDLGSSNLVSLGLAF
jgi:hypothetical protein